MEFHENLQELRKKKGLTQEELAEVLYVSRTAISKYFGITLDTLLSSEEILVIAEDEYKRKEAHIRSTIFGLLDCGMALLLFLPFFGQKANGIVQGVSLLVLTEIQIYLKVLYFVIVIGMAALGSMTLALRNHKQVCGIQNSLFATATSLYHSS